MPNPTTFYTDVSVIGQLRATGFSPPPSSVGDPALVGGPGAYVQAAKLQQRFEDVYAQASTASAAADQRVVRVVRGATAALLDFGVGAVTGAGAASNAVVDLLKNGASVLTAAVTLDNTTAPYALKSGALSVTACAAGDVLEVRVTSVSGANLAKGLFARLALNEDPA